MPKVIIHSDDAPAAVGAYSQAIRAGNLLFTSGQVALDPTTSKLIDGDIEAQTHQVMKNLQAVLAGAGADLNHVVKATVFLADINDFAGMNGVYSSYMGGEPPARSAFQVGALPLGAIVEIEMVALLED